MIREVLYVSMCVMSLFATTVVDVPTRKNIMERIAVITPEHPKAVTFYLQVGMVDFQMYKKMVSMVGEQEIFSTECGIV